MHHAQILIGHFRKMVGNWPVASYYFALCIDATVQADESGSPRNKQLLVMPIEQLTYW